MINRIIENLANDVRIAYAQTAAPVDLFEIAERESIALVPIENCVGFHGRIEFLRESASFAIYYPDPAFAPNAKRVRFSIGHELGHYFIDEHRDSLVRGQSHNSTPGFICENELEMEADEFAAALLIPGIHIENRLRRRAFMALHEILKMADDWQSSARSATIRYVRYTGEACGMVISKQGRITRYIPSDEAESLGYRFTGLRTVPDASASAVLLKDAAKKEILELETTTKQWFPFLRSEKDLHEESFRLGDTGYILTLLSMESDDADDS